jgi:uncharacterized protein (DUF488 family)
MMGELFTVGSSNQNIDDFIKLLQLHEVNFLVDVRSVPHSRFAPQFNEQNLKNELKKKSIQYSSFKTEFGARRLEMAAYIDGRVSFDAVKELDVFKSGVNRIAVGIKKGYRIALMCTEKNPIECHRFVLVSRNIELAVRIRANHILIDGSLKSTEELEDLMLDKYGLKFDLFHSDRSALVKLAYKKAGETIAYEEQNDHS